MSNPAAFSTFEWPEPTPLPQGLSAVLPFKSIYIPKSIVDWIMDISDRMQVPPDFAAATAYAAMGSTLGRKISVQPKRHDDWREVPNVWSLIVGRPGAMKSPAMNEVLAPIKALEETTRQQYASSVAKYEQDFALTKIRRTAVEKVLQSELSKDPNAVVSHSIPSDPDVPKRKRYMVSDTTYEALGLVLAENPNGVLVYRDEMMSLMRTLDKEEQVAARGLYLTGWNGNSSYTFDRIGRGHHHIPATCISMLGGTQPDLLRSYIGTSIRRSEMNDGMIQRFGILVWPDNNGEIRYIDRNPDYVARSKAEETFRWLAAPDMSRLMPSVDMHGGAQWQPYLSFDDEAQQLFQDWFVDNEKYVRSGELGAGLEGHFSKYRKLVPALALINHIADRNSGRISRETLERAINYSIYLKSHAVRAYGAGMQSESVTANAILKRIRQGKIIEGFTRRHILQSDWSNLNDANGVQAGLDLLVDLFWLFATEVPTGGRAKTIYSINPRAFA